MSSEGEEGMWNCEIVKLGMMMVVLYIQEIFLCDIKHQTTIASTPKSTAASPSVCEWVKID